MTTTTTTSARRRLLGAAIAATTIAGTALAAAAVQSTPDVDSVATDQLATLELLEADGVTLDDPERFDAKYLDATLDVPVHAAMVGAVDLFVVDAEVDAVHAALTETVDTYVLAERAEVAEAQRAAEEAAARKRAEEAAAAAEAARKAPAPAVSNGSVWDRLAECESNQRWSYNGGSGFDGGLQFHPNTWSAYKPAGYPAYAYQATRAQQIAVAEKVLASQGWGAWPACSRKLGLR